MPLALPRLRLADDAGFSLPELLVTMVLFGILSAGFAMVISSTVTHSAVITNESVLQTETRVAINQVVKDLREASLPTATATSPFVTTAGVTSPTSLTFYAPDSTFSTGDPTDYHLREINYQVVNGALTRASAVSSNTGGPSWTIPALGTGTSLLSGIQNSTVFTYYNGNQPPALTTDPAAVRTVVVTLTIHVPGTTISYTYSGSATLRETPPS